MFVSFLNVYMKVQNLCVFKIAKIPSRQIFRNPSEQNGIFKKRRGKNDKENMTKKLIRI